MAITGLILFGFLIAHMLGNLQVFLGRDVMNHYAEMLHGTPEVLWGARTVLLISVLLHIIASIQLSAVKNAARPVAYVKSGNVQSTYASRTMMLSGPVIGIFVVFHLSHLTGGAFIPNYVPLHAYDNVVNAFQNPLIAGFYVFAMILVALHLSHGIWSSFQSIGFNHPRYTPLIKKFAAVFSWILIAGFISVPVAVLTGIVHL